jgi:hypothetical protein
MVGSFDFAALLDNVFVVSACVLIVATGIAWWRRF